MAKLQTFFLMLACLAMLAALAAPTAIDAPAPSALVDTEASTNVAFDAGQKLDRQFNLSLELDATTSNCVEIAFGRDGNANGVLDRTEADLLMGWDAGAWFYHDRRTGSLVSAARSDGHRRLDWNIVLNPRKEAKSLSASDNDGVVFTGSAAPTLFDGSWNLMRVTTRGLVDPDGLIVSETKGWGFRLILR